MLEKIEEMKVFECIGFYIKALKIMEYMSFWLKKFELIK